MVNIERFSRQIVEMRERVLKLHQQFDQLLPPSPGLLPYALKELGVASEELEIAMETMRQQNDEFAIALQTAVAERQRYQFLFECTPIPHLVTDVNGVIQEANRAAASLFGIGRRFLVGKPLTILIQSEQIGRFQRELSRQKLRLSQATAPETYSHTLELHLNCRDQRSTKAVATLSAWCNVTGTPIGFLWLLQEQCEPKLTIASSSEADTSKDQLAQLLEPYPRHVYDRGKSILLNHGTIWYIESGLVRLSTLTQANEDTLIGLIGAEAPFGANFTVLPVYQATALSEVRLVEIPQADVTHSLDLARLLFAKLTRRLQQTETLLAISGNRRVKDRLYHLLQLLKVEVGEPVPQGVRLNVRLTHEDLASACCTTRVTITRTLGHLQQLGKLGVDSKGHLILLQSD